MKEIQRSTLESSMTAGGSYLSYGLKGLILDQQFGDSIEVSRVFT